MSQPFCGDCSRARLSSDGVLYTCLFAQTGTDLRGPLRSGTDDVAMSRLIRGVVLSIPGSGGDTNNITTNISWRGKLTGMGFAFFLFEF